MKKKLLIVVDYQNDFVTGSLGFPGAEAIEQNICDKIELYRSYGEAGQVIFTMDTHQADYMQTCEGKHLPVEHCIEDENGWQLFGKVADAIQDTDLMFKKPTFPSLELGNYLSGKDDEYDSVELAGVVTNICVVSNMVIVKAALPNVDIVIDPKCVASFDEVMENKSFDLMENLHAKVLR